MKSGYDAGLRYGLVNSGKNDFYIKAKGGGISFEKREKDIVGCAVV